MSRGAKEAGGENGMNGKPNRNGTGAVTAVPPATVPARDEDDNDICVYGHLMASIESLEAAVAEHVRLHPSRLRCCETQAPDPGSPLGQPDPPCTRRVVWFVAVPGRGFMCAWHYERLFESPDSDRIDINRIIRLSDEDRHFIVHFPPGTWTGSVQRRRLDGNGKVPGL